MKTIPIIGALPYEEVRDDCHNVKDSNSRRRSQILSRHARRIADELGSCYLVPVPSHQGQATHSRSFAYVLAAFCRNEVFVADILCCTPHASLCDVKHAGGDPSAVAIDIAVKDDIVNNISAATVLSRQRLPIYLVDNVVDTGHTAEACLKAIPADGIIAIGNTYNWK